MESCLKEPPPTLRKVIATDDNSCPSQFVLCLDTDAGLDFETNQRSMKRWMKEAWSRCGILDEGTPDGGF